MKCIIEFEMDNAAFAENFTLEVKEVLQQAATKTIRQATTIPAVVCDADEPMHKLLDSNGNVIGQVKVVQ